MTLGELIKSRREAQGMTLDEVADAAGCSKSYLWEIENRVGYKVSLINAVRLSVALGIHINLLASAVLESAAQDGKGGDRG
ncbi:helix-turn-helix family protein [Burkholderia gladioli]|uniref:Helix-turn-helix family protein n=1 Tax=Burkholderia gladioli TaxID=28095 RepID=A0AAW3F0A2_BURGA|nr:helix-turn-helix transcriptional regulator [Burkholderia gladioli]KGC14292.1 helix-turn-helix family protein [Burkholderia gladioli]